MTSKPRLIRLCAAVIALLISCLFVSAYNQASLLSYERGRSLPEVTGVVVDYAGWAYCLPVVVLLLGLWLLFRKGDRDVAFECLVSFGWLAAFFWALAAILAWQVTHMKLSGVLR
jgi:uncharacterized BrkB/YihY/UPF0761 family membrane protein